MSTYEVTEALLHGPIVFTMKGHDTSMTVDGDGVLEVCTGDHNACMVAGGSVIKGIRLVTSDGDKPAYEVDDTANLAQFPMFMLVSDGAPISIVHESLDVTEQCERISVDDGASTAIDAKMVQAFFWPWLDGGTGRVRVFDWAGV